MLQPRARNSWPRSQGSALLSTLFIMVLIAIAATAMMTRLRLDLYRTHSTLTRDKLYFASQAVTFWAMETLFDAKKIWISNDPAGKLLDYAGTFHNLEPNVKITGALYDLQTRLNLNDLVHKASRTQLVNLIKNVQPQVPQKQARVIVESTHHFIRPYQPEKGDDPNLNFYVKQTPAYLPSHQFMKSVSEFRLIRGVTSSLYLKLVPYLTALPEYTPININTAPKPIIMSLGNGLTSQQADELLKMRNSKPFSSLNSLKPHIKKLGISTSQITTQSQYFLAHSTATLENQTMNRYVILKRTKDPNGQVTIRIVREYLG